MFLIYVIDLKSQNEKLTVIDQKIAACKEWAHSDNWFLRCMDPTTAKFMKLEILGRASVHVWL